MFSQLGPLFKTTFRQAESNDTRQKIPHQERDDPNKKQNEKEKSVSTDDLWQDNTSVSIEALRAFLVGFLKELPDANNIDLPQEDNMTSPNPRPKEKVRPQNTHNAKAVRAYQAQAAHSTTDIASDPNQSKKDKERHKRHANIENQELREIYLLIDDLKILSERGVQMLTIEKNGTFVESLRTSTTKAL